MQENYMLPLLLHWSDQTGSLDLPFLSFPSWVKELKAVAIATQSIKQQALPRMTRRLLQLHAFPFTRSCTHVSTCIFGLCTLYASCVPACMGCFFFVRLGSAVCKFLVMYNHDGVLWSWSLVTVWSFEPRWTVPKTSTVNLWEPCKAPFRWTVSSCFDGVSKR